MASTKEIKSHIASVQETKKITSAMYLIASTKMRKVKRELDQTRPYFDAIRSEIKRIFRTVGEIDSQYFYPVSGRSEDLPGAYGYLVITADKGLAGSYNQNALRMAQEKMVNHSGENKLFVVGEYGRQYYTARHIPIEKSFLYTAQNPTLQRARDICDLLLDLYQRQELRKIYVIYTDLEGGMEASAKAVRLLPFHHAQFTDTAESHQPVFQFLPDVEQVLDNIIPSYVTGFIYSALVDSFCSEQNARMAAMDSANQNAQALLDDLSAQFHHARQSAITQEITEISSGALGQRRYQQQLEGGGQP